MKKILSLRRRLTSLLIPIFLLTTSCEKELAPITDVKIQLMSVNMGVNDSFSLNTVVTLSDGTNLKNASNLIWKSSDESLFTVDNGIITSYKEGKGTVTVISKDGTFKDSCPVVCVDYLFFTAVDESADISCSTGQEDIYVQFSYNQNSWVSFKNNYAHIMPGQTVYLRANNPKGYAGEYGKISISGNPICGGNIMSLISYEDIVTEIPVDYCFEGFFKEAAFRGAPRLPATKLKTGCYASMFEDSGNIEAPDLPAMKLEKDCYERMFCKSKLEKMPELKATELAPGCYSQMFYMCQNLKEVTPLTSAGHLPELCFNEMFENSSIVTAPKIKAVSTDEFACYRMFKDCQELKDSPSWDIDYPGVSACEEMFSGSALATAPAINSKKLSDGCFGFMFANCNNLTIPPDLPFKELAPGCYYGMFYECKNLLTAPELPSTRLEPSCYSYMFCGCLSLLTAPELPALELKEWCYAYMFQHCQKLTKAPDLNALHLAYRCYQYMFQGCWHLTYLKAMFLEQLSDEYILNWLWDTAVENQDYSGQGDPLDALFIKNPDNVFDENLIWLYFPYQWKIENYHNGC